MPLIGSPATVAGKVAAGGLGYTPPLPAVPFVVETPGGKTGHARDIATLKELRAR